MEDQAKTEALRSAELQMLRQRITEIEADERAQRGASVVGDSEEWLRLALDATGMGIWNWHIPSGKVAWSERVEAIFGFSAGEFPGTYEAYMQRVHPADRVVVERAVTAALNNSHPDYNVEHRILLPDGCVRWIEGKGRIYRDEALQSVRLAGTVADITARKQAEVALRESEERFRSLLRDVDLGVLLYGPQTEVLLSNQTVLDLLGLTEEQLLGKTFHDLDWNLIREDGTPLPLDEHPVSQAIAARQPIRDAVIGLHRPLTQELVWLLISAVPQLNPDHSVRHVVCSFSNITARKHTDAALRAERDLLTGIMNTSVAAITVLNPQGTIIFANDQAEQILGLNQSKMAEWTYDAPEWNATSLDGEPLPAEQQPFRRVIETGEPVFDVQHAITPPLGQRTYLSINGAPIKDANGVVTSVVFSISDITERKQAEAALRESEERYRIISESVWDYAYVYRIMEDGVIIYEWVTDAFTRITGYTAQEMATSDHWQAVVYPADRPLIAQTWQRLFAGQSSVIEYRIASKDEQILWLRHYNRPVWNAEHTRVIRVFGAAQDITKLKHLEQQLNQAQKMEAIGRLAGGIAHDFNNILTVILGNSGLLLEELDQQHPLRYDVEQIQLAAERATGLTHQLLAFSRQQVLQPQTINLNTVVTNMTTLLRRLIGEDVELVSRLKHDLGYVQADPGQIEQVMMNLAINARDAMTNGGTLTIETDSIYLDTAHTYGFENMQAGAYSMLAVSDTGGGMDVATQALIFEPFFTTKEPGKGTGLGLATVHGIINQSGGHIWVYSEVGHGTTFKIYLPQVEQADTASTPSHLTQEQHDSGTILLVEDEPQVRELARRILQEHGYHVLEAGDGQTALLTALRYIGPIHLLLTDAIMPGGMSGQQLAEQLSRQRPEMRVLYMSGYTDSVMAQLNISALERAFLQKPFTQPMLLSKIWEVLHS